MFLETEKLIARCIQRTNENELEQSKKDIIESNEAELDIEAEVAAATKMKVLVLLQLSVTVYSLHDIYLVIIRIMLTLTS